MEVGTIIVLKLTAWAQGQLGLITRHFRVKSKTGDGVTPAEVASEWGSGEVPADFKALLCDEAEYLGLSVRQVILGVPSPAVVDDGQAGFGTGSPVLLPTQTCGMITYKTNLIGRIGRGRNYIPFPGGSDVDPVLGTPTDAYVAKLEDHGSDMASEHTFTVGANSNVLEPVLVDSFFDNIRVITGFQARQKWALQHRRGNYGASNPREIAV